MQLVAGENNTLEQELAIPRKQRDLEKLAKNYLQKRGRNVRGYIAKLDISRDHMPPCIYQAEVTLKIYSWPSAV